MAKKASVATVRAKFLCKFVGSTFNDTLDHNRTVVECKVTTVVQLEPVLGDDPFEQQEGHELVVSNGGRLSLQFTDVVPVNTPGTLRPAVHPDHAGMFEQGKEYIVSVEAA